MLGTLARCLKQTRRPHAYAREAVRIAFLRRASAARPAGAGGGLSVRVGNPICGRARGAFMLFLIRSPLHPASKRARAKINNARIITSPVVSAPAKPRSQRFR